MNVYLYIFWLCNGNFFFSFFFFSGFWIFAMNRNWTGLYLFRGQGLNRPTLTHNWKNLILLKLLKKQNYLLPNTPMIRYKQNFNLNFKVIFNFLMFIWPENILYIITFNNIWSVENDYNNSKIIASLMTMFER